MQGSTIRKRAMVTSMTLHAQERLRNFEQLVVRRAVGAVAIRAVFGYISMFINEWPLVFHVATGASCLDRYAFDTIRVGRVMRVMAVGTSHFMLRHRMVRELRKIHFNFQVAAFTQLLLVVTADFLLWPNVQFVTVEAADVI